MKIFLICFIPITLLIIGHCATLWMSSNVNNSLEELLDLQQKKENLLNEMTYSLGYTGGIHAFKNYILRQEEIYYHQASVKLTDTLLNLKKFKETHNTSKTENELFVIIENTVKAYIKNLDTAKELTLLGRSDQEIDKKVKIDDGPADNALKRLRNLINSEKRMKIKNLSDNLFIIRWIESIFIIIAILVGVGVSTYYYKEIKVSINYLNLISKKIKDGESVSDSIILEKMSGDELKEFALQLNKMGKDLKAGVMALEKSNQELSQYAYFISHDLKAPIRKVSNCTDLLALSLKNKDNEKIDKYMDLIKVNCIEMLELNKAVLNLSDVKSGEITKEYFNITPILNNALEKLTSDGLKEIPLHTNFRVSKIYGSKKLIESLLYNLISNSVKYKHPERKLEIYLTTQENSESYLFNLEDNGVGLEQSKIEKALQPFTRFGEHSGKHGYGIGLSLSQQIVHAHGGELIIDSEKELGFKIKFSLKKQLM